MDVFAGDVCVGPYLDGTAEGVDAAEVDVALFIEVR